MCDLKGGNGLQAKETIEEISSSSLEGRAEKILGRRFAMKIRKYTLGALVVFVVTLSFTICPFEARVKDSKGKLFLE